MPGRNRRLALVFLLLWTYLVLYPNPFVLGASLYRFFLPPVEAAAVAPLLQGLPDGAGPAELEKYILKNFPYQYDWQAYGYPWYFPSAAEAVQKGKGDCKTRFIVLASLFTALQIPYELRISPTHIWVNYAGKEETGVENTAVALFLQDEGKKVYKLPRVDWASCIKIIAEAFWVPMPQPRKIFLQIGPALAFLIFLYPSKIGCRASGRND